MNLFDRMIDAFSEKDLKRRIRGVVAIGLALSILTIAGAYKFAWTTCTIDAEGMALLLPNGDIAITIPSDKITLFSSATPFDALITIPDGSQSPITIKVISIDPNTMKLLAQPSNLPKAIEPNSYFRISIVLDQQPYWKLLWGAGSEAL